MKRILLSVLLIVSIVLIGQAIADPPVMERAVPELQRRMPARLPDLTLDVSCFVNNQPKKAYVRVWNIDANGNNLSIYATKTTANDGRARFHLYKGNNYRIRAKDTPFDPIDVAGREKVREFYNMQESAAIALHLSFPEPGGVPRGR